MPKGSFKLKTARDSAVKRKTGRPSTFDQSIADTICKRLAQGEAAVKICDEPGMPSYGGLLSWRARYPHFNEAYARARSDSADLLSEQIIAIADERVTCSEDAQRNRLRVDARKWLAAKLKPSLYGEQLAVAADLQVNISVQRFTDATVQTIPHQITHKPDKA